MNYPEFDALQVSLSLLFNERLPQMEELTSAASIHSAIIQPHRARTEQLLQTIRAADERQRRELVERTLKLLRSDVPLATCLRLVGTLRQQPEYEIPGKLVEAFLECRNASITEVIERLIIKRQSAMDAAQTFEAVLRVMRESIMDVISQYQVLFSDLYPLCKFIIGKVEWLSGSLRDLVKQARNTLILASYWNQLVLLNSSYASIGAAFLPLIEPLFVAHAKTLLSNTALIALNSVQAKLADPKAKLPSANREEATRAGLRPPESILTHPILIWVINSFADLLEQVRVFAIPALNNVATDVLSMQIKAFEELLQGKFPDQPAILTCYREHLTPFILDSLRVYFSEYGRSINIVINLNPGTESPNEASAAQVEKFSANQKRSCTGKV